MTNENKIASMDAVGEMYDMGNLLLKEGGFPHLPNPRFVPEPKQSQSDAWNDAGTKPSKAGVYETRMHGDDSLFAFQLWTGDYWDYPSETKEGALRRIRVSANQNLGWREVQP
jgi:hypothetical protein